MSILGDFFGSEDKFVRSLKLGADMVEVRGSIWKFVSKMDRSFQELWSICIIHRFPDATPTMSAANFKPYTSNLDNLLA